MTENQELKMQLLDKFANIEKPETVDFCKAAFDWLTDEPIAKPEEPQPQGSAVIKNSKPDGFYLVFENGESIQYNPIYGGEIVSDSPVKYVGIKWGDRSLKVALHDQAAGEDITLTASEDKTKGLNEILEQIGGEPIADDWFWTSTEYSATNAWLLYLSSGGAFYTTKASYTFRVRAVSAFIA